MVRIYTRRKERIIVLYILVVVSASAMLNLVSANDDIWGKCTTNKEEMPPIRNLRVGNQLNITLEMSSRITHQLSTHIYRILLQEKLGYARVKIIERDDYNATNITKRFQCVKAVNSTKKSSIPDYIPVIPESIINLEVPVPPEVMSPNDETCAIDLGTIVPPGYFGWFIPVQLSQAMKKYNKEWPADMSDVHWTLFRDPKFVKLFDLSDEYKDIVNAKTHSDTGTKSYFCNDPRCTNGWYLPEKCRKEPCAVLLASDFQSSEEVIDHINEMKLSVKVAWLGKNLREVSSMLRDNYTSKNVYKSFMIFSWTPSDVIFNPKDFVTVTLKRCDYTNGSSSMGCFYGKRRSVKYAWKELQSDNHAYHVLKEMSFLEDTTYEELIQLYAKRKSKVPISEIACEWVKTMEDIWKEWLPELKNVVTIGGIFPISGSAYIGRGIVNGAMMAKDAINRNRTILPNYHVELLVANGQCRADKVMKAFIDYLRPDTHKSLVGVLGPACSDTVEPIAGLSKYYKTITISYSAEGALFSDRDKYPYFIRTIGENKHYKFVYLELLKKLGWHRVAALTEDGQKYTEYISHMEEAFKVNDIQFILNRKFPRDREKNMTTYLEDMKNKNARIIIADVFDEIARNVMCTAYKLKMTARQGYVWFLPTWLNSTWYDTTYFNSHLNESINCTTEQLVDAINGYFSMTHAYYGEDDLIMQENIPIKKWKEKYMNESRSLNSKSSNYAGYAYDAVWSYALALDKLMKEDPEAMLDLHSVNVTNKLTDLIKHLDFNGVSGRINFRGGPTRFSVIHVMQWYNNVTNVVGRFTPNISSTAPEIIGGTLELNESAINWLGGRKPDDGTPQCTLNSMAEFFNVSCDTAIIILHIFIIFLVMISFSSIIIIIIKKSYDKKVKSNKEYMKSLGLEHLLVHSDQSSLDKWEIERDHVVLNRKLGEGAFGTVYGGEASLPESGWTPVAVKTLKVGATTEEKLDFLSEAEVMKRFDHKNIVKLLGVCTKIEPVYTIMEFMLYGDLKTYLLARRHLVHANNMDESEEVSAKKLTSMALDVARGLSYLAELKYVHRDVASRNCLLNGQRVVKLGDFGMTRPTLDNDYYKFNRRGMLPVRWMAPESLALGIFTPSSDVWSYGVLLYEIITFGSFPFQGLSNTQVLDHVKVGNHVTVPSGVKPALEFLLENCWRLDPKERPSASEIVEHLANNSRLISPCLDVPLASVQMEDTAQLEMQLPDQFRKCSSSLSFKNLPLLTAISSISVHSPTRKQASIQADSGVSIPMENCCPKEPLLPSRSDQDADIDIDASSGCSKYITVKHMSSDSGCDQDDHDGFIPTNILNGHAISKV